MKFDVSEEFKNFSGIYFISNSMNEKKYIGRTYNFKERYTEHKNSFKRKVCNLKFKELLNDISIDDLRFSVIELCDKSKLKEREEFWIKYYDSVKNGLNIFENDEQFFNKYKTSTIKRKKLHKKKDEKRNLEYSTLLLNQKIRMLLKNNRGDLKDFAIFVEMSVVGLLQKLQSEKVKDNLSGAYRDFLVEQKEKRK